MTHCPNIVDHSSRDQTQCCLQESQPWRELLHNLQSRNCIYRAVQPFSALLKATSSAQLLSAPPAHGNGQRCFLLHVDAWPWRDYVLSTFPLIAASNMYCFSPCAFNEATCFATTICKVVLEEQCDVVGAALQMNLQTP